MSGALSKSLGLSSALDSKKQGIVSILSPDNEIPTKKAASLRRTLSADMSSKKWTTQSGFSISPIKKIASSDQLSPPISDSSSDEEGEKGESQSDIWASIQEGNNNNNKKEDEKLGQFDIWSSIVSKKEEKEEASPPYVHPLVKRSKSCLSEKSLEICTESLGSETGSDGFSSYSPSENGESEEEQRIASDSEVGKYNYGSIGKKLTIRSFPPPIPSLSSNDGVSVKMTTRRDNGRLVLEAVSVPSKNNFLAQRRDGRLVLTLAGGNPENEEVIDEIEEEIDQFGVEIEEIGEEIENDGFPAPKFNSGVMNFHRLAPMVKKNPNWANKSEEEEKTELNTPLARSLPPLPPGARRISAVEGTAGSLNGYEFFWRPKPMVKDSGLKPNDLKSPVEQNLGLVPLGCKEPRRSTQFWGPHCIAT